MKKIFAVAVATVMTVAMSVSAFAADTIQSTAWWSGGEAATPIAIAQGETVKVSVKASALEGATDTYVALIAEVTDGTNYLTTTSDGDAWFFTATGTVVKETGVAGMVADGNYTIVVNWEGNVISVDYIDDATGEKLFTTLTGTYDDGVVFAEGSTNVVVTAQVGSFEVAEVVEETPAGDSTPTTGDMTAVLPVAVLAVAAMAVVVVMKKKAVTE